MLHMSNGGTELFLFGIADLLGFKILQITALRSEKIIIINFKISCKMNLSLFYVPMVWKNNLKAVPDSFMNIYSF